jgi:hypothetical protein
MERFREGEHVRLRNPVGFVRAGSVGTIQRVYRSVDNLYDVQFDGHDQPQLIYGHDLERVDDTPEAL